ncbi:MAG: AAA family ATPase [Bacteroidales bacterium]
MIEKEKAAIPAANPNNFGNKGTDNPAICDEFFKNLDEDNVPVTDELDELLEKCRIRITDEYEEPEPLLQLEGETGGEVPVFTRGNISMIQGKAKSRKTFLTILLIVRMLEKNPKLRILVIDTEQGKYHALMRLRRLLSLLGWEEKFLSDRIKLYALRELDTDKRAQVIERLIIKEKPDMTFLDGVRDIMRDFNDPRESSDITDYLMRLTSVYKCHICNVLHENKNDTNARGHAGSELQNKAETVISVSKDGETTKVEAKYCRNPEFKTLSFKVNENGLPELCKTPQKSEKSKAEQYGEEMEHIFRERQTTEMSSADLQAVIIQKRGVLKDAALKRINTCIDLGILEKIGERKDTRYKCLFCQK